MNDPAYVQYLEAKLAELEAQRKMLVDAIYYRDAVIRRYNAENLILKNKLAGA